MSEHFQLCAVARRYVPHLVWWLACKIRVPSWIDREDGAESRFGLNQLALVQPFRWILTRKPTERDQA